MVALRARWTLPRPRADEEGGAAAVAPGLDAAVVPDAVASVAAPERFVGVLDAVETDGAGVVAVLDILSDALCSSW